MDLSKQMVITNLRCLISMDRGDEAMLFLLLFQQKQRLFHAHDAFHLIHQFPGASVSNICVKNNSIQELFSGRTCWQKLDGTRQKTILHQCWTSVQRGSIRYRPFSSGFVLGVGSNTALVQPTVGKARRSDFLISPWMEQHSYDLKNRMVVEIPQRDRHQH